MSDLYDHAALKALAAELHRPLGTLHALASNNDPFLAGLPSRRAEGEWFADLWHQFDFPHGMHLRRIHYVLISQKQPIKLFNGFAIQEYR